MKKQKKGILVNILRTLNNMKFWTIVGVIVTIVGVIVAILFGLNTIYDSEEKEIRKIKIEIEGVDITDEKFIEFIYLIPTGLLPDEFLCLLPIYLTNNYNYTIEELSLFYATKIVKERQSDSILIPYSSKKIPLKDVYKKHRFMDDKDVDLKDNSRTKYISRKDNSEIVVRRSDNLNPNIRLELFEYIRFDTLSSIDYDNKHGYTSVKDKIKIILSTSYKDQKNKGTNHFYHLYTALYNYSDIETFIQQKYGKQGGLSSICLIYDPITKKMLHLKL